MHFDNEIDFLEEDHMTVDDFKENVDHGFFTDDDGFAYFANETHYNTDKKIYPSHAMFIPDDITHVVWFNR